MPANAEAFADEALGGYRLYIDAHDHLVPAGRGGHRGQMEAGAVVAAASVAGAVPLEVHEFLASSAYMIDVLPAPSSPNM